ncbi:hypothetical protein Sjap_001935 [Stephania japonica]|uniref:Uncharacterized protein n=1 Tax=Stephania japonica TaxID=461633 RepID=A0AAP0KNH0_9MAGN
MLNEESVSVIYRHCGLSEPSFLYLLILFYFSHFPSPFKLQDNGKAPTGESEVKFQLSRVTLEPMMRSMAYVSEHLAPSTDKLQVPERTSGETETKFQVSRDGLGSMLRSMAYICEQLLNAAEPNPEQSAAEQRH